MDTVTQLRRFTADGAHALLPHWQLALRAEAKSPGTIDTYTYGLRTYLTWCGRHGEPPLARTTMTTWMSAMLDAGATCLGRCRGLRGAADCGQAAVMTTRPRAAGVSGCIPVRAPAEPRTGRPPETGAGGDRACQNFPGNWAMMPLLSMSAISSMWCSAWP